MPSNLLTRRPRRYKPYRRTGFRKRFTGSMRLANRINRVTSTSTCWPGRVNKNELKYYDCPNTEQNRVCTVNGVVTEVLFLPSKGTGGNQVIGDTSYMKSIQLEMLISSQIDGNLDQFVHIALVYDSNPNGTLAQYTDIWLDPPLVQSTAGVRAASAEIRNMDYRGRFIVIKDWRIQMGPWGSQSFGLPATKVVSFYKKLPCLKTVWETSRTDPDYQDIYNGALLLTYRCANDDATNKTYIDLTSRIRYED